MDETPMPVPSHPEDHLIKVYAASPCLGELSWAKNFPDLFPADREPVPGQDMAGVVVTAPAGSHFKSGDEVFCRIEAVRPGSGREYTLARTRELALKPKTYDWIKTAATPLSALTAFQGLFVQGTLDSAALTGDAEARARNGKARVLITAAGGGVGGWAVQFARAAGAGAIVGVCSGSKAASVRSYGATEIVDYTVESLGDWAKADSTRACDLVFDCVGGTTTVQCWSAVKDGGALLSISNMPEMVKPEENTKTLSKCAMFIVEPLGSQLTQITNLIDSGVGKFEPLIDSVVEFEEFQSAFDKVESGHAKGKVIIKIGV
jgi:NADPH:quinone reductase-like Zn-dependent oxidoreductase